MAWNSRYDKELIKKSSPIINKPTWVSNAPCGRKQCTVCANVANKLEDSHDRFRNMFNGRAKVTSGTLEKAFDDFRGAHKNILDHIETHNPMAQELVANYNTHVVPVRDAYKKFLSQTQVGPNDQLSNSPHSWKMLKGAFLKHFNETGNADGAGGTWYNALLRGSQTQNRRLNRDPQWANPGQPQDKGLNSWQHGPEGFAQNPEI